MFMFTKRPSAKTILITSSGVLTGESLLVEDVWQQRHVPHNMPFVLSRALVPTSGDPLDDSLNHYLQSQGSSLPTAQPLHTLSFDHHAGVSGNIWHLGADYQIDIKGMPERVLELCDMSDNERESITLQVHTMSGKGLYVVALASGSVRRSVKQLSDLKSKEKLSFIGLIGLQIGVSPAARRCLRIAHERKVAVYIATGLHPTVAYYLGRQAQLAHQPGDVIDMRRADITHTEQLQAVVNQHTIFARASSKHKKRILAELKNIDATATAVDSIATCQKLLAITP